MTRWKSANAAGTSTKNSNLVCMSSVTMKATDWLWFNRIPRGGMTLLAGQPGVGKSQQQCDIIAHVTTGKAWPDGTLCPTGDVILITCEDGYDRVVVPRLVGAGADLSKVFGLKLIHIDGKTDRAFLLTEDLDELERHLNEKVGVLLVAIDPITGFVGSGKIDSNSVTDIRGVLAPLHDMAERRNIAVHAVTHPPKGATVAMDAFIGSQAFVAASRMAVITTPEIGDDERPTGRYLVATPRNSWGPPPSTMAYWIEQTIVGQAEDTRDVVASFIRWEQGKVDISASSAMARAAANAKSGGERSAMAEAITFLRRVLAKGPVTAKDALDEAKANLISERTLERARAHLGVIAEKGGMTEGWTWDLPKTEDHRRPPNDPQPYNWRPSENGGGLLDSVAAFEDRQEDEDRQPKDEDRQNIGQELPGGLRGHATSDSNETGNGHADDDPLADEEAAEIKASPAPVAARSEADPPAADCRKSAESPEPSRPPGQADPQNAPQRVPEARGGAAQSDQLSSPKPAPDVAARRAAKLAALRAATGPALPGTYRRSGGGGTAPCDICSGRLAMRSRYLDRDGDPVIACPKCAGDKLGVSA